MGHNRPVSLAVSPPRILLVEDDATVSEVVTRYLEREGFVVEVAGEPAVLRAGDREVDTGDTSTVTVHVRRLREKIEPDPANPRHVRTVWGVGYRFEP